jgi:thiosulfate dehydrogenase [quinone] large subunit
MHRFAPEVLGYTTLRLGIGMSMLIHGVTRIGNISAFTQQLVSHFAKTWLPDALVIGFACITPPVELLIGILVVLGLFTRQGLVAGGIWMVALIFGSTLAGDYDVVGIQLLYSLIFFLLLRHEALNELSFDRRVRGIERIGPGRGDQKH